MINTINFNFRKNRYLEVSDVPNTVQDDLEFEVWCYVTEIVILSTFLKKITYGRDYP